jgi:16S rRNA (guanine527-N7)-methyltransferase
MRQSPFPAKNNPVDGLEEIALELGCEPPLGSLERLAEFASLIGKWNRRKRIVGSHDPKEIIGVHLADCLALAGRLQRSGQTGKTLLDVGSGAGLPGLALSLLLPTVRISLCEVSEKRVAFLFHARRKLGAPVDVLHENVHEVIDRSLRFDHVVSRAVFEPQQWLEIGQRCVQPTGSVWCMVTARQQEQCQIQGESYHYSVAGDRKRLLVRVSAK